MWNPNVLSVCGTCCSTYASENPNIRKELLKCIFNRVSDCYNLSLTVWTAHFSTEWFVNLSLCKETVVEGWSHSNSIWPKPTAWGRNDEWKSKFTLWQKAECMEKQKYIGVVLKYFQILIRTKISQPIKGWKCLDSLLLFFIVVFFITLICLKHLVLIHFIFKSSWFFLLFKKKLLNLLRRTTLMFISCNVIQYYYNTAHWEAGRKK